MWAVWTLFESKCKERMNVLAAASVATVVWIRTKKTHQPNLSHFCCNLPLSICHTIVTKVLFHKNCAVHFISTTFSINFVFSHFSVSIFLPRLLSLFIFFSLDAFLSRSGLFSSFLFLIAHSFPLYHTVSFFPSLSLSIIPTHSFLLSLFLSHSLAICPALSSKCTVVFLTQFIFILAQVISWVYDLFMVYVWFLFIQAINVDECKNLTEFCWIESKYSVWWHQFVVYYVDYWASVFVKKKTVLFVSASIKLDLIQCLFGCMSKWLTDEIV